MEAGFSPAKRLGKRERTREPLLFARRPLLPRQGFHASAHRCQPRQINKVTFKFFLVGNRRVVFFVNFVQPLCYTNRCQRVGIETFRLKEPVKRRFLVKRF